MMYFTPQKKKKWYMLCYYMQPSSLFYFFFEENFEKLSSFTALMVKPAQNPIKIPDPNVARINTANGAMILSCQNPAIFRTRNHILNSIHKAKIGILLNKGCNSLKIFSLLFLSLFININTSIKSFDLLLYAALFVSKLFFSKKRKQFSLFELYSG